MKFSIKDFFRKWDKFLPQITFGILQIWLHLLKKSLMENFIFCAVNVPYIILMSYYHIDLGY